MDYEKFWLKLQEDISNALQTAYNQGYEDGLKHGRVVRPRKVKTNNPAIKPIAVSKQTLSALVMLGRQTHGEG